jgi:hypothetical protein
MSIDFAIIWKENLKRKSLFPSSQNKIQGSEQDFSKTNKKKNKV